MKVLLGSVLMLALAFGSVPARAEIIDLSTWTCSKFQNSGKEEIGIILAWLNGYYRGEDDPPIIDTDKFVEDAKKLGKYCSENPSVGLITAMDELFTK
ncbi:MAG TPA: HdeA/HdeB family chaperone [Xanthobacteraceae bacterium]|nr:HdeA/HdeB family chaperone [Xanthobacteraceae bacterium]